MKNRLFFIALCLGVLPAISSGGFVAVFAQTNGIDVPSSFQHYRTDHYTEKVYLQADRDLYLTGETIRFKVFCLEGSTHKTSPLSKVVYVELIRDSLDDVANAIILLKDGKGSGSLYLPTTLPSGNYTLRAYTKWMRNFYEIYFFHRKITVINPFRRLGAEKQEVPRLADLKFFPEGGYLVEGQKSKVAFVGTDQRGKGITVRGWIGDENGQKVIEFNSLHAGIGSFEFTPEEGKNYTAYITGPDSLQYGFPLPKPLSQGLSLHVENHENSIKIHVALTGKGDPRAGLFIHTRNVIRDYAKLDLTTGQAVYTIEKSKLPPGIAHITLFDAAGRPARERLLFIRPKHLLDIEVNPEKSIAKPRERIKINFQTSVAQNAKAANLAVSVFKYDENLPEAGNDIVSYLLLTSDLKGRIENPAFYFNDNPDIDKALDNLMLTHGWRRFKWESILNRSGMPKEHIPEYRNMIISGRILEKSSSSPVSDTIVYLSSPGKYLQTYVSQSNENGRFYFELKNFYGNKQIILQTQHKPPTGYDLQLDPVFSTSPVSLPVSPLRIRRNLESYLKDLSFNMQISNAYKEVLSPQESIPGDTSLFYGQPDERYYLDDYTRFPVMEEVMREYVHGVLVRKRKGHFHFKVIDPDNENVFKQDPFILVDGVPVFDTDRIMNYDPRKVERLDVLTRKYFLGRKVCHGIVNFTTYKGDLEGFDISDADLVMFIEGLQAERQFYTPTYDTESTLNRIPDYRNLLYWNPDVVTDSAGSTAIEFYSSDATGIYKVVVEGLTEDGRPGHREAIIVVRDPENK